MEDAEEQEQPYPDATALATAAWKGQVEKVKKLIKDGADVNERGLSEQKGFKPESPLQLAIDKGHYDVAKVLLELGADVNQRALDGSTPLIQSARTNKRGLTKLLLANGASCNGTNTNTGGTALHAAVERGADRAVQVLLDHHADINLLDNNGYAPLHEAAKSVEITDLLLEIRANPNIQNTHNHLQPLHMAARHGSARVCRLLLSAGANVNAASKDGSTPLHEAAEQAHDHILRLLASHGASCTAEDKFHRTPLAMALRISFASDVANAGDQLVASVQFLLSHGASTREKGQDWPELAVAALGGHVAVVRLLLDKGAAASDEALTVASQTGHLEVVKLLLRHRDSAKQPPGDAPNALHVAARFGHVDVAALLLKRGADTAAICSPPEGDRTWTGSPGKQLAAIQIALERGHAATGEAILKAAVKAGADVSGAALESVEMLHKSASKGDNSILQLLLDKVGVDPNSPYGREQHSPLHTAAKSGHQGCLDLLLKAGADINQRNKRGHTPLFVAVNGGHFFVVQLLLKNRADPSITASDTRTALFAAAANTHHNSLAIVDCLLDSAANNQEQQAMVSARTRDGRTILHSACASSNVDVVKRLLEAGAAVNVQSDDGATPLARTAACGNVKIIMMLEHAGGKVDMRNASGMTPLAYSAGQGNVKALQTLIDRGANVHTRNKDGTTPLHQAASSGNQEIVTALLSRGADPKAQDKNAYMPHHDAATRAQLRALTALLHDKRTPIDEGVHDGLTALHLAASEDNYQVIEVLLAHGVDVDKRSYVDGRTALHYAASWGNVHAVKALLEGGASLRALDNTGKTALHWAAGAPVIGQDEFVKEQAIKAGATERSFVTNAGIVQVLYELLKHDPEGASIIDDDGHLPIEVAANKLLDQDSEVMDLVFHMLEEPANVAKLSGNSKSPRQQDRPGVHKCTQSMSGRSSPAPGGPRMPSPQAGLSPNQQRQAAAPTPRHLPQQPEQYQDEEENGEDEFEDGEEDEEWYAEAGAAAEAAAQELLLQDQAEKEAEQARAAKAAAKKAAKKKRQKAAKTGGANAIEEDADDADTVSDPMKANQSMAAHAAPIAHPGTAAAAARQSPFGMALPGQGLPAAAPSHWQAAAGPQGAVRQLSDPKASAVQAPEQEAAVNSRQGKKRGGKKQAQKAAAAACQLQMPEDPSAPPTPYYTPAPNDPTQLTPAHTRPSHPTPTPQLTPYQPHLQQQQHYTQPQHYQYNLPTQGQTQSNGTAKRPQYDYQPAHLQQPEPRSYPNERPTPAAAPSSQPQHTRAAPPGFVSHHHDPFPPLHQAPKAGGKKQQGKPQVHQAQGQQQQQYQQYHGYGPDNNWVPGVPDSQDFQQQRQVPHSMAAGDCHMLSQIAQMQQQLEALRIQQQQQQQRPASSGALPRRAPLQLPPRRLIKGVSKDELDQFTCPITHAVMWKPVVASDGYTYEKSAIEEWLFRHPEGRALSPMTQVPMTRTIVDNHGIANLISSKEAK